MYLVQLYNLLGTASLSEDVPLVEFMYLVRLYNLLGTSSLSEDVPLVEFMNLVQLYYLLACQVTVTVGNPGLYCCVGLRSSKHKLTPWALFVDSANSVSLADDDDCLYSAILRSRAYSRGGVCGFYRV